MKMQKIHVNNYRMLQNFDFELEDELSLIIGKNNCGKTSLLSVLDKFIGIQSSSNSFLYNDFNSNFQDQLYEVVNNHGASWDKIKTKGIELFIYLEFNENDKLVNLKPLMLDLNPNNNVVIIKFEYSITEQKLNELIENFEEYNKKFIGTESYDKEQEFDIFIKNKHKKYFSLVKKAVLYDVENKEADEREFRILDSKSIDLSKIICFRYISARRDTVNKDSDSTLSSLSNKYYEKTKIDEDPAVSKFEDTLHETDKSLSNVYQGLFEDVVNKIKKFGGIRKDETVVKIISTLSQQQLLKGNTTVVYENNNHQMPESYNGLGYLNLISMIMEIEIYLGDFLKRDDESKSPADINILFIEEPEAHTHPQLQYIFIKNIKDLLKDGISDEEGNLIINLQTILTTHSSHIVSECDFDDIKYFSRVSNTNVISKNLKELKIAYKNEKDTENNHFKFLKQYLTLNYAEVFFADKVILFEGDTERILLPAMMKKVDEKYALSDELPMLSQNISLVAVGAYSQIFDKLLSFIGIKTLIITDIDAGKMYEKIDENGKKSTSIGACSVEEADRTTNSALLHYYKKPLSEYSKENKLDFFKDMKLEDKILIYKDGFWESDETGNLMIVFQIEEQDEYYPRSFEDAFVQINRDFIIENKDVCESLKNPHKLDHKDEQGQYSCSAYDIARDCITSKTSFALDILINSIANEKETFSNWEIPPYIEEGLLWLKKN